MMATDSVKLTNDSYVHRLHGSGRLSGKLHKGHSITAATSSIPSKYQTIVIDNSEKRGFASKTKRFHESYVNDYPGPGTYVGHQHVDKSSPSYSKKGTGGFASKDRRLQKHIVGASPGTGAYALPSYILSKKDFNKSDSTSSFHQPIAQNVEEKKFRTPGPNEYNVTGVMKKMGKSNNVNANAAFKSVSKRETFDMPSKANPAPWQYHVKEDLIKPNTQAPISIFKSKTLRQMAPSPDPVPGPGAYKPHEQVDSVPKTVFPRKHYLCISAPAMPLPKAMAAPGPGAYELVDYEGPVRHYMSGSVFVSSTSRWSSSQPKNSAIPGPAHYRPTESSKQSFIYNSAGRWI